MEVSREQFEEYLTVNTRLKSKTINTYLYRFDVVSRWLNENQLKLTKASVSKFLFLKRKANWKNSTINNFRNTLVYLDKFYKYSGLEFGFSENTSNLPKQMHDVYWLTTEELDKLLHTKLIHKSRNGVDCSSLDAKNLLLTKFMSFTGCRIDEATSLTVNRLNIEEGKAYIAETKNGEGRNVFFGNYPDLKNELREAIENKKSDNLVFTGSTGNKIIVGTFNQNLRRRAREAGIIDWEKIHSHTLRHTFATLLHNAGTDIVLISKLLGHKDIKTTVSIYIHWQDEILKKATSKHPLLRQYIDTNVIVEDFKKEIFEKYDFTIDKRFKFDVKESNNSFELKLLF